MTRYTIDADAFDGPDPDFEILTEATDRVARQVAKQLDRSLWLAVRAGYDYLHVRNRPEFSRASKAEFAAYNVDYDIEPSDDPEPPWEYRAYVRTYDLRYWTPECLQTLAEERESGVGVHHIPDHHEREYP